MSKALDRLEIKGFKSIRATKLSLQNLNVFIGANGSGKSNLVLMFHMLREIVDGHLQVFVQKQGGANALFFRGTKVTEEIEIGLTFDPNGYRVKLVPTPTGVVFSEETCWFHGPGYSRPYDENLGSGHTEAKIKQLAPSKRVAKYCYEAISRWTVYHFHDTSPSARVKQQHNLDDNLALRGDGGNLAAFLRGLRDRRPAGYAEIVRTIQLVAPFFDDFVLEPLSGQPDQTLLRWREKGSEVLYTAQQLSDGTLRFICLVTALLQPDHPPTIIIDEPELGLHPYAIVVLTAMLQTASERTQVIACTQSVTLLNQLDPSAIVVVDRVDGTSVFRRPTDDEYETWLDGYSLGDLWEKNIIGGRPR